MAPTAAPEPPPAPEPNTSGQNDLDSISALWPAVVDVVRGGNAMLAALLDAARPIALTDSELTLAFAPNAAFMKRKAEEDEHRRAAAEALRNVTGTALALRYELSPDVTTSAEAAAPQAAEHSQLSDEELVRRFVEELDAQEIERED